MLNNRPPLFTNSWILPRDMQSLSAHGILKSFSTESRTLHILVSRLGKKGHVPLACRKLSRIFIFQDILTKIYKKM